MTKVDSPTISFMEEDARWLHHPHDDALVINLSIADFIILLVTIGTYPQLLTKEISFLVVDCSSAYNAIIRRPTHSMWRVATSTYHLLEKFPTR